MDFLDATVVGRHHDAGMTYDNEAIVRHAYHAAEGSVLDIAGFVDSFAEGRRDQRLARLPQSETPAGIVQPTGAKIDFPCADFWYLRDGKIETFNCYVLAGIMLAQMGVMPNFASAVAAPMAERSAVPGR
jgi:hypothetical protein